MRVYGVDEEIIRKFGWGIQEIRGYQTLFLWDKGKKKKRK